MLIKLGFNIKIKLGRDLTQNNPTSNIPDANYVILEDKSSIKLNDGSILILIPKP